MRDGIFEVLTAGGGDFGPPCGKRAALLQTVVKELAGLGDGVAYVGDGGDEGKVGGQVGHERGFVAEGGRREFGDLLIKLAEVLEEREILG